MCELQITTTVVCNAARTECNNVAELGSPSKVVVGVRNTGSLREDFVTTLSNCSHPTIPVPAQLFPLDANETTDVYFEVLYTSSLLHLCSLLVCIDSSANRSSFSSCYQ